MASLSETESAFAKLTARFIDNSFERLDRIESVVDALASNSGNREENFLDLKTEVHSLKGAAGTFGFQSVTTIAHRLEDYIENATNANEGDWDDVLAFIDNMRRIFEGGKEPSQEKQDEIYAALPIFVARKPKNRKARIQKALLVEKIGVMRMIASTELSNLGIDVSMANDPIEALERALKLKPDVIFCSQQFDRITGLEFYRMIKVLDATKKIPFALMTTDKTLQKRLTSQYSGLGVIIKDAKIREGIEEFLLEQNLLE